MLRKLVTGNQIRNGKMMILLLNLPNVMLIVRFCICQGHFYAVGCAEVWPRKSLRSKPSQCKVVRKLLNL